MFAIFKRTLVFRGPKGEKLLIAASGEAKFAPEWIRKTRPFEYCSEDGTILETKAVGAKRGSKPSKAKDEDTEDTD